MPLLYRKKAMARLNSLEQLDRMIVITPSKMWVAVVAGFVLIAVLLVFMFTGRIYLTENWTALYLEGGDLCSLLSPVKGFVTEVTVEKGYAFQKDEVICVVTDAEGTECPVVATQNGICNTYVKEGDPVSVGQRILTYWEEAPESASCVCILVPVTKREAVQPGAKIMVTVPGVDVRDFGQMTGNVIDVDTAVLSMDELVSLTGSEKLSSSLLGDGNYVMAVCQIQKDEHNENVWSQEKGKSLLLYNGMILTATVVTSEISPFNMLIR